MDSTRHIGWSRPLMQGAWLQEGCACSPRSHDMMLMRVTRVLVKSPGLGEDQHNY